MAATEKRPEIIELSKGLQGIPVCEDYDRMISGMMYVRHVFHKHRVDSSGTIPTSLSCSRHVIAAAD